MCKPAQSLHDPNPQSSESFPVLLMDYGEGRESVKRRSFGRLHWHADLQFVLVSMGSLELDCSGAHAALADGQGAFLNAGAPHRIAPGVGRAYTSLLFPAKMLGFFPGSEMSSRCVEPYVGTVGEPCRILDGSESWHQEALRELWKATSLLRGGDGPLQRYRACAAIAAAWGTYVASIDLPLRNPALALAEERMRAFVGFIDEHYAEHVSLADIAAAAGVSKAECGRVFRRVLQTTPTPISRRSASRMRQSSCVKGSFRSRTSHPKQASEVRVTSPTRSGRQRACPQGHTSSSLPVPCLAHRSPLRYHQTSLTPTSSTARRAWGAANQAHLGQPFPATRSTFAQPRLAHDTSHDFVLDVV